MVNKVLTDFADALETDDCTVIYPDWQNKNFPDGVGVEVKNPATRRIASLRGDMQWQMQEVIHHYGFVSMHDLNVAPFDKSATALPDKALNHDWHTDMNKPHVIGLFCEKGKREARTGLAQKKDVLAAMRLHTGKILTSPLGESDVNALYSTDVTNLLQTPPSAFTLEVFTQIIETIREAKLWHECLAKFFTAVNISLNVQSKVHWQRWRAGSLLLMSHKLLHAKEYLPKPERSSAHILHRLWDDDDRQ